MGAVVLLGILASKVFSHKVIPCEARPLIDILSPVAFDVVFLLSVLSRKPKLSHSIKISLVPREGPTVQESPKPKP